MSKGRVASSLRLDPVPEASASARRYVRDVLRDLGAADVLEAAELGVSELVTNASRHARTAITVVVVVTDNGRVRIEVGDGSPRQPEPQRPDASRTTGRGLMLLAAYGRWGVAAPVDGRIGKTVWFEPAAEPMIPQQQSRAQILR